MLRRFLWVVCFLVAADLLLLAALSYFDNWHLPLAELIVMAAVGMAVIVGYQARWSKAIAENLDDDTLDTPSRQHCQAESLLLVAGILLVIPGLITDAIGLLLLVPQVRTRIARGLRSH